VAREDIPAAVREQSYNSPTEVREQSEQSGNSQGTVTKQSEESGNSPTAVREQSENRKKPGNHQTTFRQ
jgi:hypothetical protein